MAGALLRVLSGWPGPRAWRRLHRATRNEVLELAGQGELHPDPTIAAISVAWARWRRALSPWRQLGIAIAAMLAVQAAMGLLFLLLMLVPGSETGYDGSLLRWVQVIGALGLTIWRLLIAPSSAAYEILRLHDLANEQDDPAEGRSTHEPWREPSPQKPKHQTIPGS
jgi:hypothetical protein